MERYWRSAGSDTQFENLRRCNAHERGGGGMAGQVQAHSFSCPTRQESCNSIHAGIRQDCQLVDEFQQVAGDAAKPDPLFFVECWTFDTATAAKNLQQRQQGQSDGERSNRVFRDLCNLGIRSFLQQRDLETNALSSAGAAASAGHYYAEWSRQNFEEFAARMPDGISQQTEKSAKSYYGGQKTIYPMTRQYACQLLGVSANSTRRQIKTAYRRMASQWHPDRLEFSTKQELGIATEQMAAINEAYRLLRSCPHQKPVCPGSN